MKTEDIDTIFVNTKKGPVKYMGGPNFLDGKKRCLHCNSSMERIPLRHQFVRVSGGKIIVDIRQDGLMYVSKIDPNWHWACKKCVLSITPPQSS